MKCVVPVQSWLPPDVADQVKSHCAKYGLPVSEFVRSLVIEACDNGLEANRSQQHLAWISSDLDFAAVALDALLAGHPDPNLRARVHDAFARKEARRRAGEDTSEGAGR